MELAVTKAKDRGFGIVGTYGSDTSTGAIGYWAKRVADAGLLGFVFTSPLKVVAPHGSSEPIFGTNPLSIGIPSADKPLVFDMATSAMAPRQFSARATSRRLDGHMERASGRCYRAKAVRRSPAADRGRNLQGDRSRFLSDSSPASRFGARLPLRHLGRVDRCGASQGADVCNLGR